MIIPVNITINVDIVSPVYSNMHIYVYGDLYFISGQKIRLDCNSSLEVFVGGTIGGSSAGSKIEWCGSYAWTGVGPDPGPILIPVTSLPITLVNFSAAPAGMGISIDWTTATETDNDFFTIEKSRDGFTFEVAGVVESKAPSGNSNQLLSYVFFDEMPYESTSYYRLRQTDFNGQYSCSFLVAVEFTGTNKWDNKWDFELIDSPGNDNEVQVLFLPGVYEEVVELSISDMSGRTKSSWMLSLTDSRKQGIDISGLTRGAYIITASAGIHRAAKKLLLFR
jgi:hypothetical protein